MKKLAVAMSAAFALAVHASTPAGSPVSITNIVVDAANVHLAWEVPLGRNAGDLKLYESTNLLEGVWTEVSKNADTATFAADVPMKFFRLMDATPPSVPCASLSVNPGTLTLVAGGAAQTFTVTASPNDTTDPVSVQSNDSGVATVSYNSGTAIATVTPVAIGNTTISVTCGTKSTNVTVTVISLSPLEIEIINTPVGETFTAEGYTWRVLMKDGNDVLIITEQIIMDRQFDPSQLYPKWSMSGIRKYLNGNTTTSELSPDYAGSGFLQTLSSGFQGMVKETTLSTRTASYDAAGSFESTKDKVFLLSIEEAFYAGIDNATILGSATTGTASIRTTGNTVVFANNDARKATSATGVSSMYWLLRSPSHFSWMGGSRVALVMNGGDLSYEMPITIRGVRPALWVHLGSNP